MTEGTLRVNDRLSVYLRAWEPAGSPRGTVALVHGLGEHAGQYDHVAGFLADRGFLVLVPDLPGHGRNPGTRGHASYAVFDEVIEALLVEARRQGGAGLPVFLYGHSTGANRALWWQIAHPDERLAGIVASSPSLGGPDPQPSAAKKALARVLARIWPSFTMENGLDLANLSRDPAAVLGTGFPGSWAWFDRWRGDSRGMSR